MYGEKQIISPDNKIGTQTNGLPVTNPPVSTAEPVISKAVKRGIQTNFLDLMLPYVAFFSLFMIIDALFWENGFGVATGYIVFLTYTIISIVTKQKKFSMSAVFPVLLSAVTAIGFSIHYVTVFSYAIPFLFYLSGLSCMSLVRTKGYEFKSYLSIYDQFKAVFLIPHSRLFLPLISLWQSRKVPKAKKSTLGILLGILCGIPVFLIVTNLLVEGDAAFSGVMNDFTKTVSEFFRKLSEKIDLNMDYSVIMIALLFTPWLTSTVFAFRHGVVNERMKKSNTEDSVKHFRIASNGVLGGFYGIIALCYVVYLVSQFSYLFGAFSGNIPHSVNISLSEYARRGFFEMSTVALINLGLIGLGAIISKRDEKDNLSRLYKIFAVFFSVFTLILIATAMSKMALYITELGLTEKRILVSVADIILSIVFICVLIKIFKNNFPYMKIIMYTALIFVTLYFVISPDLMVARFNTHAYLSGRHKTIDMETICYLTDNYESIMALDKLKDCDNEVIAATAKAEIYDYYQKNIDDPYADTTIYSCLNNLKLHRYIKANEEEIKSFKKYAYYAMHYEYDINMLMKETEENEALFEIRTAKISLTINTEKDIYGIYFSNDYSDFEVFKPEYGSTVTFDWEYADNVKDCLAEIGIDEDGVWEYHNLSVYLEKDESGKAVIKDTYSFELLDGDDGELIIVEK